VYSGYRDMPRVFNGYGTLVVSTSSGVTTGRRARVRKAGGELLCTVW
jgi:small subunit ribosomal protein S8